MVEINDYIKITLEDNMQLMARYPDGFFDWGIVDPPYGIGATGGTGRAMRKQVAKGTLHGGDWDSKPPPPEYFTELFRVTKKQIIWGGNYFNLPPSKSFVVWDKGETMYNRDFAECELAWVTPDKPAKIYKKSPIQRNRIHVTQKPVDIYRFLFYNYVSKGDKILDTHFGSGSVAIALDKMNKTEAMDLTLVACEIDEINFNNAVKRVKRKTATNFLL